MRIPTTAEIIADLDKELKELAELRALLLTAARIGREEPADTLRRLLRERDVLEGLLKKSGAVENVGVDHIRQHLEWLMPKFLEPLPWPGNGGLVLPVKT